MCRVLRLTKFHSDSLNSAWCRYVGIGAITSLPLPFPPTKDYETVLIRVSAVDNVVARLNEHAFLKSFLTFVQEDDPFPHKITARVDKWWRGPDNAEQCEGGELTKNGASALVAVAWCTKVRQLLRAEIEFQIPGACVPPASCFTRRHTASRSTRPPQLSSWTCVAHADWTSVRRLSVSCGPCSLSSLG
eukprot:2043947-Rhodomonas_salina.1